MTLNLRKLASLCTQLAFQGCQIIKKGVSDPDCHKYLKGEDDQVTDADYKIQSMIIQGIKMHYPHLHIVCEESQQYKGLIEFDFNSLREDILPHYSQINKQLDVNQACLWIDPIDCTKGFINGNFEDVTVLIGLSYHKRAVMGVIGTPFKLVGYEKIFDPVVTIGAVQERETYDFSNKKWSKKTKSHTHKPPIVCSSNTRTNQAQEKFLQGMGGRNVTAGGAGRKIMMVANCEADAMIFLDSWTHLWDSCAGEAIIKSMGGYFTAPQGAQLVYDHKITDTHNKYGMLTALDRETYEKCLKVMEFC